MIIISYYISGELNKHFVSEKKKRERKKRCTQLLIQHLNKILNANVRDFIVMKCFLDVAERKIPEIGFEIVFL